MDHSTTSAEVTFEHHMDDATFKKRVIKTTILLSILTIVEVGIGLLIYKIHVPGTATSFLIYAFKGAMCILTLAKAYYIVSIFMHLGDEIRNMIMTVIVPLLLFVWFIIAFLADGQSYKNLRNTYDLHFKESTTPTVIEKNKAEEAPQPGKQ